MEDKIKLLKEKGVSLTIQRYAILKFLSNNPIHPTIDEIYRAVRKDYPTVSKATVYNTLELFRDIGLVKEINIEKEKVRFDYNTDFHHHFFCKRCKRIVDLDIECPVAGQSYIKGNKVEEIRGYVFGICSECLKKKKI